MEDEEDLEIPDISRNRTGHLGKRDDGVGGQVKKKSVSFVENGKLYKVHRSRYEPVSAEEYDDSDSVGDKGELEENVRRKTEEVEGISFEQTDDDEDDHCQDGESTGSSDGEGGRMHESRNEDGSLTFSAPLPVKMETRTGIMEKRKMVKTV